MAFNPRNLALVIGDLSGAVLRVFAYRSTDPIETVAGAGYFAAADEHGVRTGDQMLVALADGQVASGSIDENSTFLLETADTPSASEIVTAVNATGTHTILTDAAVSAIGTVKTVNGQSPDGSGAVTVATGSMTGSEIVTAVNATGTHTVLTDAEVTAIGTVKTVNGQSPDGSGAVTISVGDTNQTASEIVTAVNATGTHTILTDAAVTAIGTVKTVNGQSPDGSGAVTISTGGSPTGADIVTAVNATGTHTILADAAVAAIGTVKTVNGQSPDGSGAVTISVGDTNQTASEIVTAVNATGTHTILADAAVAAIGTVKTVNGQSPDGSGAVTIATGSMTDAEIVTAVDTELGHQEWQASFDEIVTAIAPDVGAYFASLIAAADADDIAESPTRKWAAESGAEVNLTGAEMAANIDISGTTAAGAFGAGDKLLIYDASAGANRQIDYTNLPSSGAVDINGTTTASAFGSGDKLLIYDASVGANRKVDYNDLPGAGSFSASTGYTISGTTTSRSLFDRGKYEPINVLDYGADPTGSNSSTDEINAALADLRSYTPGSGTVGARLVIPHNKHASQFYAIDGNGLNATRLRGDGLSLIEAWGARLYGDMNSGLPMIDTTHSQGFTWFGGTLIGNPANPPRVGLQLSRLYTGTPGNNSNPSSQGHVIMGLTTAGQFSVAGMLNYGSEELYAAFCRFENEYNSDTSFALVQNGMHDSEYLPTSAFEVVGHGEFTGFANNVFFKCFFLHNSGSNGGPGVYLFRASGHEYNASLAQVRQDQPHFVIGHRAGEGTNACRDVTISGRYEDSNANSLLYFTGDAGAIHHGFRIKIDRQFAQSLLMADPTWSNGAGVSLEDVDIRVSNVTPQAVSANPAGYAEFARNIAKFDRVSGSIVVSQRSNAGTTFVDTRGFNFGKFNGTLKVSDRDELNALPTGNYRLSDETSRQPIDYQTEITYTARLRDTSGDLSSTTVAAKTWRVGDMQHVLFRDLNNISISGMTSGDAARILLPVNCANENYVSGRVVLTNVSGVPTPTGAILDVRIDVGTGDNYATLRMCDSGTATTAQMTVGQFANANIREFKLEYKVA